MQNTGQLYSPEQMISHSFFQQYPAEFFNYYFSHLVFPQAQPNLAHQWLKDLELSGKDIAIVTQNIDGLHQKAGSSQVYELHGSVWRNYCLECGRSYDYDQLSLDDQGIPRCEVDGAIVRPDVVLYEEGLDRQVLAQAIDCLLYTSVDYCGDVFSRLSCGWINRFLPGILPDRD